VQRTQVTLRCVVTRVHGLAELHTKCKMRGDYSGRGTLVFSEVHVRRAVFGMNAVECAAAALTGFSIRRWTVASRCNQWRG
jgi:hypothetical protein